jgi:hypothetical protein
MAKNTTVTATIVVEYQGTTITKSVRASSQDNTLVKNANRVMAEISRQINGMVQISEMDQKEEPF